MTQRFVAKAVLSHMSSIVPAPLAESVVEELWFGVPPEPVAELEATRSLAAAVAAAKGLKAFPAAASRAISTLEDPEADIGLVEHALEADPALTSTVLRVANSAVYKPVCAITSVRDAVMRLGMRTTRDLVIGVAAMGLFKDARGVAKRFRSHSVRVGAIARVLAITWGMKQDDDAFLCGLLHDVGKLLTEQVSELSYEALPRDALESPDGVHGAERERLGYDHAVLGAHVLDGWGLPASVVTTVALHHAFGVACEDSPEVGLNVALLRLADRIEYELSQHAVCRPEIIEVVGNSIEAQYASFDATLIETVWPRLSAACDELSALLGG